MRNGIPSSLAGVVGSVLPTTAKVTSQELDFVFLCLAQRREFFLEAMRELTPQVFDSVFESHYELLYRAISIGYGQASQLSPLSLHALLTNCVQERSDIATPLLAQRLVNYLQFLFSATASSSDVNVARGILRRFLMERRVVQPLGRLFSGGTDSMPADMQNLVATAAKEAASIATVGRLPDTSVAAKFGAQLPTPILYEPTGIGFMDRLLQGQIRGTVNGMLGPTGGGKTTFSIHKAVGSAREAYRQALTTGRQPELVVFVTVEESAELVRPRLQSTAFAIPRSTLEQLDDWRQLSGPGEASHYYERDLDISRKLGPLGGLQGIPQIDTLSEQERYQVHYEWFDRCCALLDLSGTAENAEAGTGFVPELEALIDRIVDDRRQPLREVVIDWAGALCERHVRATGKKEESLRHLLNMFGDECKRRIAVKHNCTVWVTHQLKTALGKASPGKLMHHSEAAESSGFAVHMATVGCLGVADARTGVRFLNFSKTRLNRSAGIRPVALRIHDLFTEMVDVSDMFTIDVNTNQIVSTTEARQVGGFADDGAASPTSQVVDE